MPPTASTPPRPVAPRIAPGAPRIAPVEPPYPPELGALLAKFPAGPDGDSLKLFRTLAVHPDIASRMRPLGGGILRHGRLDPREREIVIHRTCARAGAEYEWGVHATAFGREVGLTDAQLAATVHGGADDAAWSERDGLLVRLCDELYDTATVSAELWDRLAAGWEPDELIELVVTAGWYRLISYVINACGVQLEPWAERMS